MQEGETDLTGRTHWAVGTAAALCVTQPARLRDWVLCIGAAAVGSVISDIDVTTSDSRETLDRIDSGFCSGRGGSGHCRGMVGSWNYPEF